MKQERYLKNVSPLGTWQLTEALGEEFYLHALTLDEKEYPPESVDRFPYVHVVLCRKDRIIATGTSSKQEFFFARAMAIARVLGNLYINPQTDG